MLKFVSGQVGVLLCETKFKIQSQQILGNDQT